MGGRYGAAGEGRTAEAAIRHAAQDKRARTPLTARSRSLQRKGVGPAPRGRNSSGKRRAGKKKTPSSSPHNARRQRYLRARLMSMSDPPCASFDIVTTLAGVGRRGRKDGELTTAYFDQPWDVCALQDGSVLVTDHANNTLRRVCRRARTVAALHCAKFLAPRCPITLDHECIAVVDSGHNKIRLVRLAAAVDGGVEVAEEMALAGTGRRGHQDGPAKFAMFNRASGICLAPDGSMLVADTGNHVIRRIYTKPGKVGRFVTTLAGQPGKAGFQDGSGLKALLNRPTSVTVDAHGTILICDSSNHAIRALHEPAEEGGAWQLTTVAGTNAAGFVDGEGSQARFHSPSTLCLDQDGFLLVSDSANHAIRCIGAAPDWGTPEDAISVASRSGGAQSTPPRGKSRRAVLSQAGTPPPPSPQSPARTKIKAARDMHVKQGGDTRMFDRIISASQRYVAENGTGHTALPFFTIVPVASPGIRLCKPSLAQRHPGLHHPHSRPHHRRLLRLVWSRRCPCMT